MGPRKLVMDPLAEVILISPDFQYFLFRTSQGDLTVSTDLQQKLKLRNKKIRQYPVNIGCVHNTLLLPLRVNSRQEKFLLMLYQ